MVLLRELISHGPHMWFVNFLFIDNECWLNFLGDQKEWEKVPIERLIEDWGAIFKNDRK